MEANAVTYSASGDGGHPLLRLGKELWKAKAFTVHLSELKLDGTLLIEDERTRGYRLNLTKKGVKRATCRSVFSMVPGSVQIG